MKTVKIFAILSLFFIGCSVQPSNIRNPSEFKKNIIYIKDEKTGLCFAIVVTRKAMSTDQSGVGMACVPCSQKVEALAK